MVATHSRKLSTTRRDALKSEQILFRVTPECKRQLFILLAARGQKIQAFMERILDAALAQAKTEKN